MIQNPDYLSSMSMRTSNTVLITLTGSNFKSSAPLVSVDGPTRKSDFAAARLSPNPASGPINVLFALPIAAKARVSVIDVAGREVRGLGEDTFSAGQHELRWDGRDDAGRPASAGVYFVRVESGSVSRVARVTRLW